uniref:Uncharacterized protein n=1 Tax=Ananas comosus var. bracteatus TaxID=296719 RepID=A0A6V7PUW3_ANACO|nr:unnamed protein product [Ananas comosus var. bracteatus]
MEDSSHPTLFPGLGTGLSGENHGKSIAPDQVPITVPAIRRHPDDCGILLAFVGLRYPLGGETCLYILTSLTIFQGARSLVDTFVGAYEGFRFILGYNERAYPSHIDINWIMIPMSRPGTDANLARPEHVKQTSNGQSFPSPPKAHHKYIFINREKH